MRWRRMIDSVAFIFAVGVAVWIRYGLDRDWYSVIGWAALVLFITPFVVSRVLGTYILRRTERQAMEIVEKAAWRATRLVGAFFLAA
jgi:Na+/H+ antiporter NhaD/arsenite permease-like protein